MSAASASGRVRDGALIPPVVAAMPVPTGVVLAEGGLVLAANAAWRRLGPGDTLASLFPDAAQALTATMPASRHAVPLRSAPADAVTWWDLALVPHPDRADAVIVTAQEVTEAVLARRDAESARESLQATATRFELAADAAGAGSWEWDLCSGRLAWSPQQFRLHGLDPQRDLPPTPEAWFALVHPDDRPIVEGIGPGGTRRPGGLWQAEFRIRRADGEWRWLLAMGRAIEAEPGGRPARIAGVNLDITERRRDQDLLREAAAQLRLAFGTAGVFAWSWEIATGRVVWSEGAEAALGLPRGGFGGSVEAFRSLVLPEDLPVVEAALARALAGEVAEYDVTFRMRRADGSVRWTATRGVVVRDEAGRPVRLVGVDHDQSDRLAGAAGSAAEVNRAADLLRTVIESTPDLVWAKSPDGRMVLANRAAIALLGGGDATRVIGRDAHALVPDPAQAQRVLENDARIMQGGVPESVEEAFGDRVFQSIKAPFRDARGEPAGLVGVSRDVTDERRTQAALAQGLERLQVAQAAAGIGIYDYDLASGRIVWDARIRELWGAPDDGPVTYDTFAAGVHPEDLPAVDAAVARALDPAGSGAFESEYRVVSRRDGATRHVSATGRVTFRDGAAVRLVGTVRDVTDRHAMEAALRESAGRWRSLLDSLHEGVMLCELVQDGSGAPVDYRYLELNEGWSRNTGIPVEAARGRLLSEVHGNGPALDWVAPFAEVVRSGRTVTFEKGGARGRRFKVQAFPMGGPRFGASMLDVTDERQAQATLQESEARWPTARRGCALRSASAASAATSGTWARTARSTPTSTWTCTGCRPARRRRASGSGWRACIPRTAKAHSPGRPTSRQRRRSPSATGSSAPTTAPSAGLPSGARSSATRPGACCA